MRRMALRNVVLGCSGALAAAVSPPVARAAELDVTFERVADTVTPVPVLGGPKGTVTFDNLGAPSVDDGVVAFNAYVFPDDPLISGEGVYTYRLDDETIHLVADGMTPFPDGVGNIVQFSSPAVASPRVTFSAFGLSNQQGIYSSAVGGELVTVADRTTPDPGGFGVLSNFFTVSRNDTAAGFTALTTSFVHGVYAADVGGLCLVANNFTQIPGGMGVFVVFGYNVTIGDGLVVFVGGNGAGYHGIFIGEPACVGGPALQLVADTDTAVPDGAGTFAAFGDRPSIAAGQVAFQGRSAAGLDGVYSTRGGLHRVADPGTPIPGGTGTFTAFGYGGLGSPYGPSMGDGGRTVFRGEGEGGQAGLYAEIGDTLHKVVDLDDDLGDESALTSLFIEPECQDANRLVFVAGFSDTSSAVYLATVTLRGDLDGDDSVGITDFLMLLAAWGPCPEPCPDPRAATCLGDLDGDCTVGITDLLALLANWT